MTLKAKMGVFMDFFRQFRAVRHVSRENCAEINKDRHAQAQSVQVSIF